MSVMLFVHQQVETAGQVKTQKTPHRGRVAVLPVLCIPPRLTQLLDGSGADARRMTALPWQVSECPSTRLHPLSLACPTPAPDSPGRQGPRATPGPATVGE